MLSWSIPRGKGLKDMVEKAGVYPVTVITSLNKKQKEYILSKDIVLCKQLRENIKILHEVGFTDKSLKKVVNEIDEMLNSSKD
jgi:hypothetical protein